MLKRELEKFLASITATQSILYQIKTHLINHKKYYLPTLKESRIDTYLVMGDLTGPSENGWKLNYPTGFQESIRLSEMDESIDKLIKREGMRSLATCYEILESFLMDITATYLELNPEKLQLATKIKKASPNQFKEKIRLYRNNKRELFNLIRQLSPTFKAAETYNTPNIDLRDWYFVLSKVRHAVVHSLFTLNLEECKFTENQMRIFDNHYAYNLD